MLKKFVGFVLLIGALHAADEEPVLQISSFKELNPLIDVADEDTWVAFDVDYNITMPAAPERQVGTLAINRHVFGKSKENYSKEVEELAGYYMVHHGEQALTDESLPGVIEGFEEKGARTMAITAMPVGTFNGEYSPGWRVKALHELGVDFGKSFDAPDYVFDDVAPYLGGQPTYTKGILFNNGQFGNIDKGKLLIKFFDHAGVLPKRFIYTDDRDYHVKEIRRALQEHYPDIEFHGYQFTGAIKHPENPRYYNFKEVWRDLQREAVDTQFVDHDGRTKRIRDAYDVLEPMNPAKKRKHCEE